MDRWTVMVTTLTFELAREEETRRVGHALGAIAFPGLVVGLIGTLGAGKTFFVRAVAEGLETPDARLVTSPTFLLVQEYAGRLPIYHFDTYRLPSDGAFLDIGPEEYFDGDGISLVEWADRVPEALPPKRLELTLEVTGETSRRLRAIVFGDMSSLLEDWKSRVGDDIATSQA
ncbi:tRNA (adenosine(37)-N6)-threonylcarbamoyltransferase complex ATPase subunit type 1 TsaE [Kolteria novifilia]